MRSLNSNAGAVENMGKFRAAVENQQEPDDLPRDAAEADDVPPEAELGAGAEYRLPPPPPTLSVRDLLEAAIRIRTEYLEVEEEEVTAVTGENESRERAGATGSTTAALRYMTIFFRPSRFAVLTKTGSTMK